MIRAFLDTMLFIYSFDARCPEYPVVESIFQKLSIQDAVLCSSSVILGELLVLPKRQNDLFTIARIERLFSSSRLEMLVFDREAARIYSELRATQRVKSLDALHLATAARAGVDIFLTNDAKLHPLQVPGIGRIIGMDPALI